MGVTPLFGKNRRIEGTQTEGGHTFRYTLLTEPNNRSPADIKDDVHAFLDGACLGITRTDVSTNIRRSNYSAVCRVENTTVPDAAIGTLQYSGWCPERPTEAQLWLNDVCRLTALPKAERPAVSPVAVLMRIYEEFARSRGVHEMWLFVEKTPEASATKLQEIYTAYGYQTVTAASSKPCETTAGEYHVMYKALAASARTSSSSGRRSTRRSSSGRKSEASRRASSRHRQRI